MFFKNETNTLNREIDTKDAENTSNETGKSFNTSISNDVLVRKSRPSILKRRDERAARRAAHF